MSKVNQRIRKLDILKGQEAALKAFSRPVRITGMGKHPSLRRPGS